MIFYQVLIGQGADLTTPDKEGWTALHCAASAGFLDVVKLLVESGASPDVNNFITFYLFSLALFQIMTKNGRTALWYAASEGHNNVLYYLLREKHDSYSLLEDRRVSFH